MRGTFTTATKRRDKEEWEVEELKKMETLTPEEVAPMLGTSPDTLRSWMRHGLIHIGIADKKDGSEGKYNYTIWRPHLEKFMRGEFI